MKSILKFTVVIALMFSSGMGMANEPGMTLVANNVSRSLIFQLESHPEGTHIRLVDTDDHIIYMENVQKAAYAKKFDLTRLEEGRYFFIMESPIRSVEYSIDIDPSNVRIVDRKEKTKPVFRQKGSMVYLNLLNLEARNVEIRVLDSSDRLLYNHVVKGSPLIEKAFNFKNAFEDKYTIIVKDGTDVYYENVSIK